MGESSASNKAGLVDEREEPRGAGLSGERDDPKGAELAGLLVIFRRTKQAGRPGSRSKTC